MNVLSLSFADVMPIRDVPGFNGFSKLERDGVLRTGIETRVSSQAAIQAEVEKLANVKFPAQFQYMGNRWSNPDGRVLIEKRKADFQIRYYDTATGFAADSRVKI